MLSAWTLQSLLFNTFDDIEQIFLQLLAQAAQKIIFNSFPNNSNGTHSNKAI